jgi:hypothetical protein
MPDIDSTTSAAAELTQEGGGELPSTVHLFNDHDTVTAAELTQEGGGELPSTVYLVDEHATIPAAEPTQASSELPSTVYLVDDHEAIAAAEPTQASSDLPSPTNRFADGILGILPIPSPSAVQQCVEMHGLFSPAVAQQRAVMRGRVAMYPMGTLVQ